MNQPLPHVSESQIGDGGGENENWDEGQEGERVAPMLTCVWTDGGRGDAPEDWSTTAGVSVAGEGSGESKQLRFYPVRPQPPLPSPRIVGSRERASFYKGVGAL